MTDGLVSYWKLDESSGTRFDAYGSNNLTDNNTVTQANGKVGNAGQFTSANNEYLNHTDNAALSTGDVDFSVSAWVYMDSKPGEAHIIAKQDLSSSTREDVLRYYGGGTDKFQFAIRESGGTHKTVHSDSLGSTSTGNWYFILAWYDAAADTINIQVNNGTIDQTTGLSAPADMISALHIGSEGGSDYFWNGRIDGVGFWKRALTAAERSELYYSGAGTAYPFTPAPAPPTVTLNPEYSVEFVRERRNSEEVPAPNNDWDNWDTDRLDRIDVKHGATVVRSYDLSFGLRSYSDDGKSWDTTVLDGVTVSGGGTNAPQTAFTYADFDNRANCGSGCQEWAYPRMSSIASGWGGTASYTYGNDGRTGTDDWYNWRVETLDIDDGVNASPIQTTFAYNNPCYDDDDEGYCNSNDVGELIGYTETTVTSKDFGGAALAVTVHKFHTDEQRAGREYETLSQDGAGVTQAKTTTTFVVDTSNVPAGGYFTYADVTEAFIREGGGLVRTGVTDATYDTSTGNLTRLDEQDGAGALYRYTEYEYVTDGESFVWIMDRVRRETLKDAGGALLGETLYAYDGTANGLGTVGELTLSQTVKVDTSQTLDTIFYYDLYGNLTETRAYESFGTPSVLPGGSYRSSTVAYDSTLHTYPESASNPLGHTASSSYDLGLGVALSSTDANGNTTNTAYDGLGRVTEITYPGYAQPNIKYVYPTGPSGAGSSTDFTGDLVSCWSLDEASGARVDAHSNNDLTDNNVKAM